MLTSEGFKTGYAPSTKMVTLYRLMIQQLSKQDYYDFGLRAIKSVLTCAGQIRRDKATEVQKAKQDDNTRENPKESEMDEANQETQILMRAIRDMDIPKFVSSFNALFSDLFPNIDLQEQINETIYNEIENQMSSKIATKN